MKKIKLISALAVASFLAVSGYSQSNQAATGPQPGPDSVQMQTKADVLTQQLASKISLTTSQKAQINKINFDYVKASTKLSSQATSAAVMPQINAQSKQLSDDRLSKIKAVLNQTQLDQFNKLNNQ